MRRIRIDHVAKSDITLTDWIRTLSPTVLARIEKTSPDEQIRDLARKEQSKRRTQQVA